MLHIVFYAKIGSETNDFDIKDVIDSIMQSLSAGIPCFGDVDVNGDPEKVKQNWEEIKQTEKDGNKTVLGGVPSSLPALIKANRIQKKPGCRI